MKFCERCNAPIDDSAAFCSSCGAPTSTAQATQPPFENTASQQPYNNQGYGNQGYNNQGYNNQFYGQPNQNGPDIDVPTTGIKVLCFLFPVVGLVLYIIYKDNKPVSSKAYGKIAIISVVISFFVGFLLGVLEFMYSGIFY